jgi:hypothetical protein
LVVEKAESLYKQFRIANWIEDPSAGEDIPIVTPGDALTGPGFGNNEYGKPSIGYLAMKDLLGDELFKNCLHAYMDPLAWQTSYSSGISLIHSITSRGRI